MYPIRRNLWKLFQLLKLRAQEDRLSLTKKHIILFKICILWKPLLKTDATENKVIDTIRRCC